MTEWRDIEAFPGYKVSDDGRVMGKRGEMTRAVNDSGYYILGLYRGRERINCRVHVLVAETFIGPRPEGMVVRHLDGNPLNNTPQNLAWGTPSENTLDSIRHGTQRNSRKTHCIHGHEFTPANTRMEGSARKCRTCCAARERRRRANLRKENHS